jgi:hypothetical protein
MQYFKIVSCFVSVMMVDMLRLNNPNFKYAETWINYLPEIFTNGIYLL